MSSINPGIRYAGAATKERPASTHVPFSASVASGVVSTKGGDYLMTYRLEGLPFETADDQDLIRHTEQWNTLLRSICADADVALWVHTLPRPTPDVPNGEFRENFCRQHNDRYNSLFTSRRMARAEHYVTLVYRPPRARVGSVGRIAHNVMSVLTGEGIDSDAIRRRRRADVDRTLEIGARLLSGLSAYWPYALESYENESGVLCSEQLTFYEFLLSGRWQEVRVPRAPLYESLGGAYVFAGAETLQISTCDGKRFARNLELKDYNADTYAGILNGFLYESVDFVLVQTFVADGKQTAIERLGTQVKHLLSSGDGTEEDFDQINQAVLDINAGRICMGEYHFGLTVFGDSVANVAENTTKMFKIISDKGFISVPSMLALDASWYSQMPGNFSYRPRLTYLSSLNFASLCSMHGFVSGKIDGNPWGPAVTVLTTPSKAPLYFNFHLQGEDEEDALGQKVIANTIVIGKSGGGKTTLVNHLLAQSQRFDTELRSLTTVVFDHLQSARIPILAMGGRYTSIRKGKPTGFNPFQLESTPANVEFLRTLIEWIAQQNTTIALSTSEKEELSSAIDYVLALKHLKLRRIGSLLQYLMESGQDKSNSLSKRIRPWCNDGPNGEPGRYAWVLDNEDDLIDFSTHRLYGFNGSEFLKDDAVRPVITMYLLHRVSAAMGHGRFIYNMVEAWMWLQDAPFSKFIAEKQKVIRKQDGLGIFDTQSPSDMLDSPISKALIEQCGTQIFLPNPGADEDEYVKGFGCSQAEFRTIKGLREKSRQFVLRQNFGPRGRRSVVAQLDMSDMEDNLAILGPDDENNQLLGEILARLSSRTGADADSGVDPYVNPDVWIPEFHRLRRERDAAAKANAGKSASKRRIAPRLMKSTPARRTDDEAAE